MKCKSSFNGVSRNIPQKLQKSFQLNDRYHSAKLTLDFLGNYTLDVPYGVTDATARRSVFYKPAMGELTQQMIDAYSNATFAFSRIASKCLTIETDILYQKSLQNLQPETYTKKACPEPQPTKKLVEAELMEEANQKFYSLFSSNSSTKKKYVADNIDTVYKDRLRHWEEVVTYFDYVESVIASKKNKVFFDQFIKEKTDLENRLYGPDSYVRQQLGDILNDNNIPFTSLPFEFNYDQKKGLIEVALDIPVDLPIPREYAQLYASGKLWVKGKQGKDIAEEKLAFYLGLPFYVASKLFGLALNIKTVRVSEVESSTNLGLAWIEFDREVLRQLIISRNFDIYAEALSYNHYFELDKVSGLKGVHIGQFNQKVKDIIETSSKKAQKPSRQKQTNQTDISIADAKRLAASIHDNQSLIGAIRDAEQNRQRTVTVSKGQAAILEELNASNVEPDTSILESLDEGTLSSYGAIDYEEYSVSEHIDESDPDYEENIKDFIQKVIDIEAPISRDVLNRRICSAMGISRVSARLNEKLGSILLDMKLKSTADGKLFFWSEAVHPDCFKAYRRGGNRDALDIAPQEIANCMAYNIDCTGNSDRAFVLRDTANEFGFTRMGVNVQAAMEAGVKCGVANGILTDNGVNINSTI